MKLCTVVLVLAMTVLMRMVDGAPQFFEGTYASAVGARATRHLAFASHPVPTDRRYECTSVDLEGRWDVLKDLASAICGSPQTTLALKIRTGVIRYCLDTGAFLECPSWKLDGGVQQELQNVKAELEATKAACGKSEGDVHRKLVAAQAELEAARAACRKAEETVKANEAATQHKLKELDASHSQTCAALRADLEESEQMAARLEASHQKVFKAFEAFRAGQADDMQERDTAGKKLAVAISLVDRLRGEVTQLELRNQNLQCALDKHVELLRVADEKVQHHDTRVQFAVSHPPEGCRDLILNDCEGMGRVCAGHRRQAVDDSGECEARGYIGRRSK